MGFEMSPVGCDYKPRKDICDPTPGCERKVVTSSRLLQSWSAFTLALDLPSFIGESSFIR